MAAQVRYSCDMEQVVGLVVTVLFWAFVAGIVFGPVWQLFSVPRQARLRGKDSGVWFLICLVWLVLFFGVSWLGYMFLLTALMEAARGGDPSSIATSLIGGLLFLVFEFLPTFAVRMGASAREPKTYRRRAGTHRRRRARIS